MVALALFIVVRTSVCFVIISLSKWRKKAQWSHRVCIAVVCSPELFFFFRRDYATAGRGLIIRACGPGMCTSTMPVVS